MLLVYSMIKRIIDISDAAYLHVKHQQLLIDKEGVTVAQICIEDLGVLILQHPAIVITQSLIITCQKNNVVVIFCDEKYQPYSIISPIAEGNLLHSKIIKQQISMSVPTRKRLWKIIVENKISQQRDTLKLLGKDSVRLNHLAMNVKLGDKGNSEAVAAQKYWKLLFGSTFKRDINEEGINALLNYGYAIIRSLVARAICGAGLHPTLGIFHKNQYNALCLADDIMEPFRPWVDLLVYKLADNGKIKINKETKTALLGLLNSDVQFKGKKLPLMVSIHYLLAEFKRAINNEQKSVTYPVLMARCKS